MKRRTFVAGATATGLALMRGAALGHENAGTATPAGGETMTQTAGHSGYLPVNGLQMYYEMHGAATGDQPPLLLLHGGFLSIATSFGPMLPQLAATRQVVAVEQQGHGHTADIDRPLSFEQEADDTAAALALPRHRAGGRLRLQRWWQRRARPGDPASRAGAQAGHRRHQRHATTSSLPASTSSWKR